MVRESDQSGRIGAVDVFYEGSVDGPHLWTGSRPGDDETGIASSNALRVALFSARSRPEALVTRNRNHTGIGYAPVRQQHSIATLVWAIDLDDPGYLRDGVVTQPMISSSPRSCTASRSRHSPTTIVPAPTLGVMEISADNAALRVPAASTAGRRRNMQANRRRDTKPELALRSALHRAGFRYRVDYRIDFPGGRVRPDIVFTRKRIAVFVDGCFWHCCPEHGSRPSINQSYWSPKLTRNAERDARNTELLREADWTVLRIWEHESVPSALNRVSEALMTRAATLAKQKPRLASPVASCGSSSG